MALRLADARERLRALGAAADDAERALAEADALLSDLDRLRDRANDAPADLFDKLIAGAKPRRAAGVTLRESFSEEAGVGPSVAEAIEAAASTGARFNAFIEVFPEARGSSESGPFSGVPFAYKDAFASATRQPTVGIGHGYRWPGPESDSLRRLAAAGAVAIGATNLDPHCYSTVGMNPFFGPVRNPCDPDVAAGGSSGGSAVAVALGIVPFALGTDTGGSVRIPASLCGVYGLKPTHGLIRDRGVAPLSPSQDGVGILAGRPAMIDRALGVLGEPGALPSGRDALSEPLRIGIDRSAFSEQLDDDVAQALARFLARLEASGHVVVEVPFPPIAELNTVAAAITGFEAAVLHAEVLAARPEFYPETIRRRILAATCIPETDYTVALRLRGAYLRDVLASVFARADFLVCPVLRTGGARLDALADPGTAGQVAREYLTLNRPVNLLGLPSLAVPAGRGRQGIPIGLQIIGPPFAERAMLSFADLLSTDAEGMPSDTGRR